MTTSAPSFADVEAIFAPTHVRLPIHPNGNCFFEALVAFFQITDHPLKGKTQAELRDILVDTMLPNIKDLLPYVPREYKVKNPTLVLRYKTAFVTTEVKKLRRDYVYDTDLGDIVPQESTRAFGINITVHDWNWNTMKADIYKLVPILDDQTLPTVHLLRTNENHYDLLLPVGEISTAQFEMYAALRAAYEAEVAEEAAEVLAGEAKEEAAERIVSALRRSGEVVEVKPSTFGCCGAGAT
jgi:hypothetical protein